MTDPVVLRLVWKEYRVQRGFWLSMAGLTLLGMLIVLAVPGRYIEHLPWLFGLALGSAAFYALGCGATLFAAEREEGTLEQLRVLAAPAGRVFLAKLGFGLTSTAVLAGVLWLLALGLARGRLPAEGKHVAFWAIWGVASLEFLAWGLFFSLLSKRALMAACMAAVATVVSAFVAAWVADVGYEFHTGRPFVGDTKPWLLIAPARLAVAAIVLLLDGWIALRWVLERPAKRPIEAGWQAERIACLAGGVVAESRSLLGRLIWQEWRQARRTIALLCGIAGIGLVVFCAAGANDPSLPPELSGSVVAFLSALMGSCAFLAEQEGQHFRFFAERGVAARRVWLAKHAVWLAATLAAAFALYLSSWVVIELGRTNVGRSRVITSWFTAALGGYVLLVPLLGYGAGQLASMLIARGLIAGFTGVIVTVILTAWLALMAGLEVDLFWSVGSWLVVFLLATWVRAPDWLLERRSWRACLRVGLLLVVPTIALPAAVAAYRVYEIPATGPGFSPDEFMRPVTREEKETAALYRRAIALLQHPRTTDALVVASREADFALAGWEHAAPDERAWFEANRESLELTLAATRRPACAFSDPKNRVWHEDTGELAKLYNLVWLLLLDARRLEAHGALDEALDRYLATIRLAYHLAARGDVWQYSMAMVHEGQVCERMPRWAAHPDQTPERIRLAIRELEKLAEATPRLSDTIKAEYLSLRRVFENDAADVVVDPMAEPLEQTLSVLLWRLLRTERLRAMRLQDVVTARALAQADSVVAAIDRGEPILPTPAARTDRTAPATGFGPEFERWARTTPLFGPILHAGYLPGDVVYEETRRRALRLVLALEGWRAEHDELPEKLDDLVAEYFARLPLDPRTGKSFGYSRDGFPTPVLFDMPYRFVSKPGQPLVWSVAPGVGERFQKVSVGGLPEFEMRIEPLDHLPSAWAFPVP